MGEVWLGFVGLSEFMLSVHVTSYNLIEFPYFLHNLAEATIPSSLVTDIDDATNGTSDSIKRSLQGK